MKKLTLIIGFIFFGFAISCQSNQMTKSNSDLKQSEKAPLNEHFSFSQKVSKTDRINILSSKRKERDTVVIEMLVPLCDVENQGVLGVTKKIADGMNARTNLYWGAGYGISTHFRKSTQWLLVNKQKSRDKLILEKLVFKHAKFENIFLIANAYRGDSMGRCVSQFFDFLAGIKKSEWIGIDSTVINRSPDLVIFNGHNGMMDSEYTIPVNKDTVTEDAMVIACASEPYFKENFQKFGSYPALLTTNLLAPEAYVIHDVLEKWLLFNDQIDLRGEAGVAYHKIQNCGIKGATNLFSTGW